jgi:trehalose 6-phosphate synthase
VDCLSPRRGSTIDTATADESDSTATYDFLVVSNRLPVDRSEDADGNIVWRTSPGGLVTALEPVMQSTEGAWIGWPGIADEQVAPFESDNISLLPVALSSDEVQRYYEGFSNDTIWPLYHDVIASPAYHREWWESYVEVNTHFAQNAAAAAAEGATVWVHDYQLQLVPKILRAMRPDVRIGFFNHIPFPAYGLYSQLPWRQAILEGLLGADVIGFQRYADAGNFQRAVRRLLRYETKGGVVRVTDAAGEVERHVITRHFPISIDAAGIEKLARTPAIQARAREIREELGNPRVIMLGVDRLDYTKGIGHRLKAFEELLKQGSLDVEDATLIQVASPSRERVTTYMRLRDEIELTVGRINGEYGRLGHAAIHYLHHGYPREEMVAMYLAADVMLVTALRDGMNLVAKEYVAARFDNQGVLILSEFAGAADELKQALQVNPHDIEYLKNVMLEATRMQKTQKSTRMRALRRRVKDYDVARWSQSFLQTLDGVRRENAPRAVPEPAADDPSSESTGQ